MIKQNKTIGDYWENKNTISLVDKNLRIFSDKGQPACIADPNGTISKIYLSIAKQII